MRLLHTSDWHLGRSFHREDLLGAQGRFVDFLVETVRSERVDAVLVSGDVYDRALPGVDAVSLCNEALHRLVDTGVRVVLISGNHDSPRRLGFGADLIDRAGVHLRTDPRGIGRPVLLHDEAGAVAVHALPYLEPMAVRAELLPRDEVAHGHPQVTAAAMRRVRSDLSRRPGARSVVLAHAFVAGGASSDSERDIGVGGAGLVPLTAFDGIDYVALGHLHGAQQLSPTVCYSGSPIAYSFSEEHHTKAVLLVELATRSGAPPVAQSLPTPVERRVARVRGLLADLLTAPRYDDLTDAYLQVTLTDADRPRDAMAQLRRRFPHTLVLAFDPDGRPFDDRSYVRRLHGRTDLEVCSDFVAHVRGPVEPAETDLLDRALAAARHREVSA